jgi:hypothetical protein
VAPPVDGGNGGDQRQHCPRCGAEFGCGAGNPAKPCACSALALTARQLAAIRESWAGCLCVACLFALAGESQAPVDPAAARRSDLIKRVAMPELAISHPEQG